MVKKKPTKRSGIRKTPKKYNQGFKREKKIKGKDYDLYGVKDNLQSAKVRQQELGKFGYNSKLQKKSGKYGIYGRMTKEKRERVKHLFNIK